MLVDGYYDVFAAGTDAAVGKNSDPSTIPECSKKYLEEVLPKFLAIIEPYCAKGQWLCGSQITIADFWVGGMVFMQFRNPICGYGIQDGKLAALEAKFPGFKGWADRFVAAN